MPEKFVSWQKNDNGCKGRANGKLRFPCVNNDCICIDLAKIQARPMCQRFLKSCKKGRGYGKLRFPLNFHVGSS